MPLLSIVTTCKGRLDHLKQTLPGRLDLPDCECVVVDYDCPQGTGDWVERHCPAARVVRVADRLAFNLAEARNLGARAAGGAWLLFLDADIASEPGLVEALRPRLIPGHFYVPHPRPLEAWGTVLVAKGDFATIDGYDEILSGWGGEDDDLTWRLRRSGRRMARFPGSILHPLQHDESARVAFHAVRDRNLNQAINALYLTAKRDLLRLDVPVDTDLRRKLYDSIRRNVLERRATDDETRIDVGFRRTSVGAWYVDATLVYRLRRVPPQD